MCLCIVVCCNLQNAKWPFVFTINKLVNIQLSSKQLQTVAVTVSVSAFYSDCHYFYELRKQYKNSTFCEDCEKWVQKGQKH